MTAYIVKGYAWSRDSQHYNEVFLADDLRTKAEALKTAKRFRAETGCTPDIIDQDGLYLNEAGEVIL